jgi:ribonuclease P protein component
MAVSRRVGNAVVRNRIRRRIREAFRHIQHDWPAGYDVVISVRPHHPLPMAAYRRLLLQAMPWMHRTWTERGGDSTASS